MSSTSAVAVLAQGLRELRDFAEGPDGEQLREATGLTAEQIEQALGGEQLPTREVTLALVQAWEGDVEAWRTYWGQIAELAEEQELEQDGAGKKKARTPAPPEPSIITPIPDGEQGEDAAQDAEDDHSLDSDGAEGEAAAEDADQQEAVRARSAARAQLEANAQAAKAQSEARAAAAEQTAARAEAGEVAEAAGQDAGKVAAQEPEKPAGAKSAEAKPAEAKPGADAPARAEAAAEATRATPAVAQAAGKAAARAEAAPAPQPKKSVLARVTVPVVLFAIGVGVGAFGDHALNSKQSSSKSAASLTPVSVSSTPSLAASSSSGTGATPSTAPSSEASSSSDASPTNSPASGASSPSTSSTVAAGTLLGSAAGIQLASGYSVNFLTDPQHPAAGTSDGTDTMGFFASSFVDGRFYADRAAILDPTDPGSFTSCLNDTRYQHDVLLSQLSVNSSFCVTTATGHLVLVTVRRLPSSTDANPYAVVDVTVWQGS